MDVEDLDDLEVKAGGLWINYIIRYKKSKNIFTKDLFSHTAGVVYILHHIPDLNKTTVPNIIRTTNNRINSENIIEMFNKYPYYTSQIIDSEYSLVQQKVNIKRDKKVFLIDSKID